MTRQRDRDMKSGTLHKRNLVKVHNKLVRDKIPEIIEAAGKYV